MSENYFLKNKKIRKNCLHGVCWGEPAAAAAHKHKHTSTSTSTSAPAGSHFPPPAPAQEPPDNTLLQLSSWWAEQLKVSGEQSFTI